MPRSLRNRVEGFMYCLIIIVSMFLFADTPLMSMCERELFDLCVKYSSLFLCSFQQSGIDDSYMTNAMVDGKGMMGENKSKRMEQVGHLCFEADVCNKHIMTTFQNCFFIHWKKIFSCKIFQVTYLIKLMKGKSLRKHSLHGKTAASVLLMLFNSGNERCHT